ncbi:hypothetical protein PhCBS80983_g04382 [Powellomyces hirtus]|uniref:CWF21 domain-containing protein n=1 Tax=Powellomyces hirtus TaxID=109895 RepID=A0A507DYM5_9FUNG|nr:hypothetical protein PhCBS80983_g04382 [Powellomyces hirtus]
MYNGIGLSTARGSGTNGYVQRNLSSLRPRERIQDQPFDDKPPPIRKPNKDILDHQKKREVEVKCMELQDQLEAQDIPDDEVEARVDSLRQELLKNLERMSQDVKKLQEHQVHELAEAKEKADARTRAAFGIRDDFVAGAAFDRDLQRLWASVERDWKIAKDAKNGGKNAIRQVGLDLSDTYFCLTQETIKQQRVADRARREEERLEREKALIIKRKEDAKLAEKLVKQNERDRKSRDERMNEGRRERPVRDDSRGRRSSRGRRDNRMRSPSSSGSDRRGDSRSKGRRHACVRPLDVKPHPPRDLLSDADLHAPQLFPHLDLVHQSLHLAAARATQDSRLSVDRLLGLHLVVAKAMQDSRPNEGRHLDLCRLTLVAPRCKGMGLRHQPPTALTVNRRHRLVEENRLFHLHPLPSHLPQ